MTDHFAAIESAIGNWRPHARIMACRSLDGGMSAKIFTVDVDLADGTTHSLVARFPSSYVQELFEDAAAHEYNVLLAVTSTGIPAPKPLHVFGEGSDRCLLIDFIDGHATAAPRDPTSFIESVASMLARIHRVPLSGELGQLPPTKSTHQRRDVLNSDLHEPDVIAMLEHLGPRHFDQLCLRHGDFWPGNLIWRDDDLVGVIDWENALIGPAVADLAITRLDVAWCLGWDAMEEFTRRYMSHHPIDTSDLAYWDLRISLRSMSNLPDWATPYASLGRPDITFEVMRDVLLNFVDDALSRA